MSGYESYEADAMIISGRLQPTAREAFRDAMRQFEDGQVVIRVEKPVAAEQSKTRRQEAGFHAMIQPWAASEGLNVDDLKRDLLREIFGEREHVDRVTGEVVMVLREPHTSKLNREKYSTLIERTLEIAAGCGVVLIAPSEWRAEQQRRAQRKAS